MTSRLLVRYEVCAALAESAKDSSLKPEAGGILLGHYRGPDIEVVGRTTPGPGDERSLFAFVRQDPAHQMAATEAWEKSGRIQTFVGEWHTHPTGNIHPSSTDLTNWVHLQRGQGRSM